MTLPQCRVLTPVLQASTQAIAHDLNPISTRITVLSRLLDALQAPQIKIPHHHTGNGGRKL